MNLFTNFTVYVIYIYVCIILYIPKSTIMLMRLFINTLYCLNLAHTVELKLNYVGI